MGYEKAFEKQGEFLGMRKGEKKRAVEMAIRLIARGDMDTQMMAELTGLTKKEIEELKTD